jgi:hypothetical protein
MSNSSEMPERMNCDAYRVEGRELVCELSGKEVRRVSFDAILGWCDTAQGSLSIMVKGGRSLDFPGPPEVLEDILMKHFPNSFHQW